MYKTLHKKQGSVTVQLRFARSSVTFCAKRDKYAKLNIYIASRYIIRIKNATHTEVIFQELSLKNVLPQINKVKGDQK